MPEQYRHGFEPVSVYANVMALLAESARPEGVVLDLGCGYSAIGQAVVDGGWSYVGLDADPGSVADLASRGLESAVVDLERPDEALAVIEQVLGQRSLAALVMIDAIEHIVAFRPLLARLRDFAQARGGAPLVVSVPNVTHLDVAAKLLAGRWDITPTGILDITHVNFFAEDGLRQELAQVGWREVGMRDYELYVSDQHFPDDHVVLARVTPLHELLRRVRQTAPAANTNQFVRAYEPGEPVPAPESPPAPDLDRPFLSVVTRTQGRRPAMLADLMLALQAQTVQDFEVLVMRHDVGPDAAARVDAVLADLPAGFGSRVRVVEVRGGGRARPLNAAIEACRGRYFAIMDDDDLPLGHWVETYRDLAAGRPGHLLRARVADQVHSSVPWPDRTEAHEPIGPVELPWAVDFDVWTHLVDNQSPNCGLAFPSAVFRNLGVRFDEELPVLEDWDMLLRVMLDCGVAGTDVVTSLYRRWDTGDSLTVHPPEEWEAARRAIEAKLDATPLVFPPGLYSRLRSENAERRRLERDLDWYATHNAEVAGRVGGEGGGEGASPLRAELDQVYASHSWRLTAPLRRVTALARAGRRRLAER